MFPAPGLTVLAGDLGSHKTLLALDLAICVALGQPWLGLPVAQSPVLYLEDEDGLYRFQPRVRTALLGHQASPDAPFHFGSSGFTALRPARIASLAAQTFARFIVIDPLPHYLRANSNVFSNSFLLMLRNLHALSRQRHLAFLLVVHATRRGLRRALAPLSILAPSVISVQRSGSRLHLQSLTPATSPLDLYATVDPSRQAAYLSPPAANSPQLNPVQSAVLLHLHRFGPSSIRSLMHATQASIFTVTKAVYRLRTAGLLSRADSGTRGQPAAYILTARGRSQAESCQVHTRTPVSLVITTLQLAALTTSSHPPFVIPSGTTRCIQAR